MPPLRPESRWSATFVQTISVISAVALATWYVRGTYEDVMRSQNELKAQIAAIQQSLDTKYVTHDQADRYASAFRWENRNANITVPEPKLFQ